MKEDNIILSKSKNFAIQIILLYKHLYNDKREFVLSKQLLRSGTSIGANINEAICGISKKDFLAKMYVAYKECSESIYWLDLLYATNYITTAEFENLNNSCQELKKLLSSITKTTKHSLNGES